MVRVPSTFRIAASLRAGVPLTLVLALTLGASAGGAAVENPATSLGLVPTVATEAQVEAAQTLTGKRRGESAQAPDICTSTSLNRDLPETPPGPRSGVGVFPAHIEVANLDPGATYRSCIQIVNTNDVAASYDLTTIELVGSPDPDISTELEVAPVSVGTWVHPLVNTVDLDPGKTVEIPYVIVLPRSIPAGTNTGGIRITQKAVAAGSAAALSPSVVHRIYVTAAGGEQRKLVVSEVEAPRLLSKEKGDLVYRTKFVVTNKGTIVDVFNSNLDVKGLGRTVGRAKTQPQALLPNSAKRQELVWRDLPWIGWYRPEATVKSRGADTPVPLPRVLILPPTQYVIALVAAVLLPLVWMIWRFIRRRQEWRAYLDEDDPDLYGDPDTYWEHEPTP